MSIKFILLIAALSMSAFSVQAQTPMTDLNNRQISETSNAIDRTLTKKGKNSAAKKSAGGAGSKKPVSGKRQNSLVSKPKTYFSYINVKVDNASPDTENLFINLAFTNVETGEVIRRKFNYDKSEDGFGVNDVPPGEYTLTASAVYKGRTVKALVGSNNVWTREETVPYSDSMAVRLISFIEDGIESIKSEPGDLKVKILE